VDAEGIVQPIQILVVEDDAAHAELIQRGFEGCDPPVCLRFAGSLREARERIAESVPNLVITDLLLPDGRGVELVPPRDRADRPAYPAIMMTSHGDEKVAVEAMKAGALDYVVKSVAALEDMPRIANRALREWHQMVARKLAETELRNRSEQLLALAHLGQQVLLEAEISSLMKEAVTLVAKTLQLPYVKLLERDPRSGSLLLRAVVGWPQSVLGEKMLAVAPQTLTGFALTSSEPVLVEDLRRDPRFVEEPLWRGRQLVSGISSVIGGLELPFGVLCAFSDRERQFNKDDVQFFRSAANILAVAMERRRTHARMQNLQHELMQCSKLSAVGELGTAVAHELNQPITAVMNYVQTCRRMLMIGDGSGSDQILQMMAEAVGEAERAGAILRRLRGLIEKGEMQRTVETIGGVVRDAAQLAISTAAHPDLKVVFELDERLPLVLIDKIQVQQVVFNLARNAIEACEGLSGREIAIRAALGNHLEVEVLVRDTGRGIAPEQLDRLFTKYFSTKEGGMGLGLSISHSIIDAHGGRLWVTANLDGGATFHFTLPVAG
jgi:two-component system, LuxR family, sensor kinase FixL